MGDESQPATKCNESPAIWGHPSRQNIECYVVRFTQSMQSFLTTLQAMRNRLEAQIEKRITYGLPSVVNPFGGFPVVRYWKPSHDFDYSLFTASALEVYMAWRIAGRSDSSIADFDGELLNSLARLFNKLRYQPISSDGSDAAAIAELSLSFKNEVDRLELFCSLTSPKEEMQPPDLPAGQASSVSGVEELGIVESALGPQGTEKSMTKSLPFGIQRCDVAQSLKRAGHKDPVTIGNTDYWKLMEELMAASPNAIPESKLKHLFVNKNDRDNAPKKLRDIISLLGLTVKKWTLMELES